MATVTSWTAAQIQSAINTINTALAAKADLIGGLLPDAQLPADVVTSTALTAALAVKADLISGILPDAQAPAISVKKGDLLINVKDPAYGATGNGSTHDDAALLAAIAAVPSGRGGTVYLPAGNYLITGSTALTLTQVGTYIRGAGPEATKITIGAGFSAASAILINADDCGVTNLSIVGASTTTTSNSVADGIKIYGARRALVDSCHFWYINGWAIQDVASSSLSTEYPDGSMLTKIVTRYCAGGQRFLGNSISGYAVNSFLSNVENIQVGVTTGASANLDGIRVEDAWDVLIDNALSWTGSGTGHSLHIVGNCAATFVQTLDALGPTTGSCVLIEDGPNGSPQNVQIDGGVIQQGTSGLRITGAANHTHLRTIRFINNNSHGLSVEGTGLPVHCHNLYFSGSGAGATGTNYDVNWSGSSTGYMADCRFASSIVATGTAGVQQSVNVASGQNVRFINTSFQGTGSNSTNWFTNLPNSVLDTTSGAFNFLTNVTFGAGANFKSNAALQPSSSAATVLSSNINGADTFDTWRITGDGKFAVGPGGSVGTRDTFLYRSAAGTWKTDGNFNIAGDLQLAAGTYRNKASAQVTVANTVTATNLTSFTVPANDMVVGATYRVKAWGTVSTTGTPTVKIQYNLGSTQLAATGVLTPVTAALTNKAWSCEAYFTVLSTGTSGTVLGHMMFPDFTQSTIAGNPSTTPRIIEDGGSVSTVNTTISNTMSLTFTWGTASTSNTITCYGVIAERVS